MTSRSFGNLLNTFKVLKGLPNPISVIASQSLLGGVYMQVAIPARTRSSTAFTQKISNLIQLTSRTSHSIKSRSVLAWLVCSVCLVGLGLAFGFYPLHISPQAVEYTSPALLTYLWAFGRLYASQRRIF